jgi:putative ABC transport system ATP-binding protein
LGLEGVPALRGVSLEVNRGEFLCILGKSGGGKTSLLNCIGTIDKPTKGDLYICGKRVSSRTPDREVANLRLRNIGFVFQTFNLLPKATAQHNVEIPLIYANIRKDKRLEMASNALDSVGLSDRSHHRPNELSGGQRQRVAIARALVNNPSIILADEPTGNLDSKSGQEIMGILDDLHQKGNTIILVTHEDAIAQHANRIIRLFDGKIIEDIEKGAT